MIGMPLESYTQNGEDVVLWRALGLTEPGRYVDVSNDERFLDSPTFLFYTQGWRGLVCAPTAEEALRDKSRRPEDEVFETESSGVEVGSLLASSNRAGQVQLLVLALGPRVGSVVRTFDWERWRPWVVAIESVGKADHQPHHEAWEADLLSARYARCLFDGVVRYYVAEEHAARLGPQLAYPAGPRDSYTTPQERDLRQRIEDLERRSVALASSLDACIADASRWRAQALDRWSISSGGLADRVEMLERENNAFRRTVSWRLTRPLRAVRSMFPIDQADRP